MSDRDDTLATFTITNGATKEEATITVEQALKTMGEFADGIIRDALNSSYSVIEGGGGLVEIDLHPAAGLINADSVTPLIIAQDNDETGLKPGRYFVLYPDRMEHSFTGTELSALKGDETDGLLLATDKTQIAGAGIETVPVTITSLDEQGKPLGGDTGRSMVMDLWLIKSTETGAFVTLRDMAQGLEAMILMDMMLERLQKSGELTIEAEDDEKTKVIRINPTELKNVDFPTDKLNHVAWGRLAASNPGQLSFNFTDGGGSIGIDLANAKDKKEGIQRIMTYAIDFSELEELGIAPKIGPYDGRIYEAVSSLRRYILTKEGKPFDERTGVYLSLTDICFAMGYTRTPSTQTKEKINEMLTKMSRSHIEVDNYEEASIYNYPRFRYDGSLLPMERITGYVDGHVTDAIIHLFREPPLFTFARERKQITSHSSKLLQTPISKTPKNILLEDYLREQIAWMKHDGSSRKRKILLSELYRSAGITTRDAKLRKRKDVLQVLDHYTACGWIAGYKETSDGYEIKL